MMTKHSVHLFRDTFNPWHDHDKNDQISEEKLDLKILCLFGHTNLMTNFTVREVLRLKFPEFSLSFAKFSNSLQGIYFDHFPCFP